MEFCSKGQLCELLKSNSVIGWEQWSDWIRQIAEGMAYLHKNKVIHRDLKSPNILITDDDIMKICDFGTSHQQRTQNSTLMSFCGTVSWMAPEMIKKEPCSEKVDVYSFGVVLWEMLTREQPFKNIDQMAIIYGVGSNILTLPIPDNAPDGMKILMKQCWSTTPRNRPSFVQCLRHLIILRDELREMGEEEWFRRSEQWRRNAQNIRYPDTLTNTKAHIYGNILDEKELIRKRHDELKHAQDIREMYENKLRRTNRMYSKLTDCMNELHLREQELAARQRALNEKERWRGSNVSTIRPTVLRAGPRTIRGAEQDIYCTAISPYSNYGVEHTSSSDEDMIDYHRRSPYMGSQASSSSGFPSSYSVAFSRQSSSRSSNGLVAKSRRDAQSHDTHESPIRTHNSSILHDLCMQHSSSSQYCGELVRGCPARTSGVSEDSGVQVWNDGRGSCGVLSGGQQVCLSQTLCRNGDGRWSDGRIAQRRKPKKSTFQRDSPARIAQGKYKYQRASYPSRINVALDDCYRSSENFYEKQRARSMIQERAVHFPSSYDEPDELNVEKLPQSASYQETLKFADYRPQQSAEHLTEIQRVTSPTRILGYNKRFGSPKSNPESPQAERKASTNNYYLTTIDPNIDLYSSMDSNNPQTHRSRESDASAETSTDEEKEENGNTFESSLDPKYSTDVYRSLSKMSSDEDGSVLTEKRRQDILMTSNSTMTSSLERSLEIGAIHSDGLSDKERRVRAVKNTIKGKTHSNLQLAMMSIMDESSTESECDTVDI